MTRFLTHICPFRNSGKAYSSPLCSYIYIYISPCGVVGAQCDMTHSWLKQYTLCSHTHVLCAVINLKEKWLVRIFTSRHSCSHVCYNVRLIILKRHTIVIILQRHILVGHVNLGENFFLGECLPAATATSVLRCPSNNSQKTCHSHNSPTAYYSLGTFGRVIFFGRNFTSGNSF